jgi:hypothetical protein
LFGRRRNRAAKSWKLIAGWLFGFGLKAVLGWFLGFFFHHSGYGVMS